MSNDWQNALQSLLDGGALPEHSEVQPEKSKTPKKSADKLVVAIEKKGRAGKTATIISGFTADSDELESIAAKLKSKLGTGGSARGGEILIQGDRRSDIVPILRSLGFKI